MGDLILGQVNLSDDGPLTKGSTVAYLMHSGCGFSEEIFSVCVLGGCWLILEVVFLLRFRPKEEWASRGWWWTPLFVWRQQ